MARMRKVSLVPGFSVSYVEALSRLVASEVASGEAPKDLTFTSARFDGVKGASTRRDALVYRPARKDVGHPMVEAAGIGCAVCAAYGGQFGGGFEPGFSTVAIPHARLPKALRRSPPRLVLCSEHRKVLDEQWLTENEASVREAMRVTPRGIAVCNRIDDGTQVEG